MQVINLEDYIEQLTELEKAHFEYKNHKAVIDYLEKNFLINQKYLDIYLEKLIIYFKAKQKFQKTVLDLETEKKDIVKWEVDFKQKVAYVY